MPRWAGPLCGMFFGSIVLSVVAQTLVSRWNSLARPIKAILIALAVGTGFVFVVDIARAPESLNPALTSFEQTVDDLSCAASPAEIGAALEGSVGVLNATRGESDYESFEDASIGDEVEFRIYIRSLEISTHLARNIHARLDLDESAITGVHLVGMAACGDNTVLLRDAVTVDTDSASASLRFIRGSVEILSTTDGLRAIRSGTDDVVLDSAGESLGSLEASVRENDFFVVVRAEVTSAA